MQPIPNLSHRDLRETGCCCTALVGKSPRRCGMCTTHSRYFSERVKWRGKSLSSGRKCDLSGCRGTGRTGTCSCLSAATKGPRGAVTCAWSSPNCCQTCDGNVTSGSTRLDSLGTGGHLELGWGGEGGWSGNRPGVWLTWPPRRDLRHRDARRRFWRRGSWCSGASCAFAGSSGGCNTCRSPWPCTCRVYRWSARESASFCRCCSQTSGCSPRTRI